MLGFRLLMMSTVGNNMNIDTEAIISFGIVEMSAMSPVSSI